MTEHGERLYLVRPLEKSDIPTLTRWFFDLEDLSTFDRSARIPISLEASEKTWSDALGNDRKNGKYWFAIDDAETNTIGIVGLESHSVINGDAVISLYIVGPERRRGVGVRTVALLSDVAFKQLGLHRITSYYHADNEGSRKLTARVGFEVEGRMRQAWFSGGQRADMVVVGLLKKDWFERRTALTSELDTDTIVSFGVIASPVWSWPLKDADG